jgi:hypothetical protein
MGHKLTRQTRTIQENKLPNFTYRSGFSWSSGCHTETANSGLLRTWGYLGSIASSAILSITFHDGVSNHGLHVIAVVMITVSALPVILTVADRRLMRTKSAGR